MCLAVTQVAKSPRWFESISIHHLFDSPSVWRSLAARVHGVHEVTGSNPVTETTFPRRPAPVRGRRLKTLFRMLDRAVECAWL